MKRAALGIFLACALTLAALPLSAQESATPTNSDTVKAEHGLSYAKPSGWVASSGKRGAVSTLKRAGDEKSQIEFRFAPVVDKQAESFFTTFHSSLAKARLERVSGTGKSYGSRDGRLTEYKLGIENPRSVLVFEFSTAAGAWLVIAMYPTGQKDVFVEVFESLITNAKFE